MILSAAFRPRMSNARIEASRFRTLFTATFVRNSSPKIWSALPANPSATNPVRALGQETATRRALR